MNFDFVSFKMGQGSGGVPLPTTDQLLKGDGLGGAVAAVPDEDYATPDLVENTVAAEAAERESDVIDLQGQIDALISKSDVVDVVGTYAELQAYDTSTLGANDVVKVLSDSTHNDARTYYRWSGTAWGYVGAEAIGYTKSEEDALLADKQDTIGDLGDIRAGAALGATAYQKSSSGIPETDLASSVQTSLNKADSATQPSDVDGMIDDKIEAIPTAKGIEKTTDGAFALTQAFYDYLDEHTYTPPAITSFSVSGLGGTAEIGTSVSVSSMNHAESNVSFITGNLTLKKDGVTLKNDIEPSSSSASVSFTEQTVSRNTAGNVSFSLSGTNSKGAAFSASVSKSFYVPKFTGTNANATITASDILSMTRASGLQTTVTVDTTKYIYFVTNGTISAIKDADTGFGVPIESAVQTVVEVNGVDVNYNVYRTSGRINAGTYRFTIS